MKLRVKPVEGCGWFSAGPPTHRVETPSEFELNVPVPASGAPPPLLIGLVADPTHLLGGLWVLLECRQQAGAPFYVLRAFMEDPRLFARRNLSRVQPPFSGFARIAGTE